jgi:hypothetical protein
MNRLTVDERRRANELRRIRTTRRASRTLALEYLSSGTGRKRNARVAMLITLALGGILMLLQVAHEISLYGPGSFLDWLLPRL